MDQLFAKYPMLAQLQDHDGEVIVWFITGGDLADPTTWTSDSMPLEKVDAAMQADITEALAKTDRSVPHVYHHPIAQTETGN